MVNGEGFVGAATQAAIVGAVTDGQPFFGGVGSCPYQKDAAGVMRSA